jgi:hypothetical protein
MRKLLNCGAVFLLLLPLGSCWPSREEQAKKLENEIRASVVSEIPALASLMCIFRVTYTNFKGRWIVSDDIYIQQDEAALDYGYRIDEGNIRVVFEDGRNVLRVRLPKGELLATNRKTLKIEKTHDNYRPKADIDAEINKELESLEKEYGQRALREASQNIKNFFRIIAAKYGLELYFSLVES